MKNFLLTVGLLLMATTVFAQNVKVKGIAKNNTDSIIIFKRLGQHIISRELQGQSYKAKLNNKGEFEITLPEEAIKGWMLKIDDNYSFLDLQAGHDVTLRVDFKKNEGQVVAVGTNAAETNFLNLLVKQRNEKYGQEFYKQLEQLAPKDALILRKEQASFQLGTLEDYHKKHPINEVYYKWLKTLFKYEPYERTLVESASSANIQTDSNMVAMLLENGINDDYAAKNSIEYNDLINLYMHYHFNGSKYPLKTSDYFDYGLRSDLTGLTKQMFLTRQMAVFTRSKTDSSYNSMYQKFIKAVDDKELVSFIHQTRANYLADLAESNRSKENISQNASLNEIFKKYKGKVIYLDFWASWCAPCKSEMPNSNALKAKLKSNDVVFLYFGYQDQKENWLAARKELEIEGEHYLLSPQLIKEANQLFEIGGIPHYVIIGKDGSIVNKNADRPGTVYDQLNKLAEK